MASSCSTLLSAPPLTMKIVPYVPRASAPNPRPKSKAALKSTTKPAKHSRLEASSTQDDGNWFDIEDFPMLDLNASCTLTSGVPTLLGAADTSESLGYDVVSGLGAASKSEKPGHHQSGWKSPGRGAASDVAKTNAALSGLFNGTSLEFPLILDSNVAEENAKENHNTTQVEPSNGGSDSLGSGHPTAGTERYHPERVGNLGVASMRALSEEGMVRAQDKVSIMTSSEESSVTEDEPLLIDDDDDSVASRPLLTRKRTHRLTTEPIFLEEASDITPDSEPKDPRLAKRLRLSERRAESPDVRPSRASSKPSSKPLDSGSQSGRAGSPALSLNDVDKENGDNGAYAQGTVEKVLSTTQPIPLEGVESEMNGSGSADVSKGSHENGLGQVGEVSGRPSVGISRRNKRSDRPVRERDWRQPQTTPRRGGHSTMPMGTPRNTTPSQSCQLSRSRTDSATRSCSPQTSPREPKTGRGTSSNYGSGTNIAYQITDLAHYHMPKGSSMVAVTVHRSDLNASLDPIALDHRLLGGEGGIFRMVQLSPNSWMLLGYRYDHGEPGACTRKIPTLNVDRANDLFSDAVSHNTDHLDDDEESENGEEDPGECRSRAGSGKRRTHVRWAPSDEARLLSYKDKMDMDWHQIVPRFPGRSEGAVKLRYFTLRSKCS